MRKILQQKIRISILVVCRNVCDAKAAFAVNDLASEDFDFEVLVAEGDNPSMQRNELVRQAQGEYVLFLDDDSIPDQSIFNSYAEALFKIPEAEIVGGPSLLKTPENILGDLSALFFSSPCGLGPFRSRYISLGELRETSEKELILCNLLMKKNLFLSHGGFKRNLYPNEENELLKRIKRESPEVKMIYQPSAVVIRKSRGTLFQFIKQLFSYGQGRSKHINLLKEPKDIFYFLPSCFSLYLVLVLVGGSILSLIPLMCYVFLITGDILTKKNKPSFSVALLSPFFFLTGHFFYGLGFLAGLFKYLVVKRFFFRQRRFSKLNVTTLKKFTN